MAIRWDDFPHNEIRLEIHDRLAHNAVGRSAEDALRHILRRQLASLDPEDHSRFIELEAHRLVEHLRCTRDVYQEFVEERKCRPILEAHWVVLRCAVFPTALSVLQQGVTEYAKLTRIPGRELSLLFGIVTRTCQRDTGHGFAILCPPDLDDATSATDDEIQSLADLINEDTLLWLRDIIDGGGVWRPFGGGPFAVDDAVALRKSFSLCAIREGLTLPDWLTLRQGLWNQQAPWTGGLCSLFGSVQEELLSQWRALPMDSSVHELKLLRETSGFKAVVVPPEAKLPLRLQRGKECEELAQEIGAIKHKRNYGGLTLAEIQNECSFFKIWKRVDVLSSDDRDTFLHPGTWESGYENLLLGKLYATARRNVAAGTINTWRKEYRAYLRWQKENPQRTADGFLEELQKRKSSYRKPLRAK